ncbi:hypothetical protein HHE06_05500 [Helicobacter heilmannii]|nr:hypothetical protein HHE06_05500 [Helicobacter heilmannii]
MPVRVVVFYKTCCSSEGGCALGCQTHQWIGFGVSLFKMIARKEKAKSTPQKVHGTPLFCASNHL